MTDKGLGQQLTAEANYIVNHYYYDVMKFCGCYTPDAVIEKLEQGLIAFDRDNQPTWESAVAWMDDNIVLVYLLDGLGLTEHGGSVGGSWLTDKGKRLLGVLKAADEHWDDEEYCGWWVNPVRPGFKDAKDEEDQFMKAWG